MRDTPIVVSSADGSEVRLVVSVPPPVSVARAARAPTMTPAAAVMTATAVEDDDNDVVVSVAGEENTVKVDKPITLRLIMVHENAQSSAPTSPTPPTPPSPPPKPTNPSAVVNNIRKALRVFSWSVCVFTGVKVAVFVFSEAMYLHTTRMIQDSKQAGGGNAVTVTVNNKEILDILREHTKLHETHRRIIEDLHRHVMEVESKRAAAVAAETDRVVRRAMEDFFNGLRSTVEDAISRSKPFWSRKC